MEKIVADKIEFIPNDKFTTNLLELWFPIEDNFNEIAARTLLGEFLTNTCKQYPEEEAMHKEFLRRYIYKIGARLTSIGTQLFYQFSIEMPKSEVVPDIDLVENIRFFLDMIYHPNEIDGEFYKFDEIKKTHLVRIQNSERSKSVYAFKKVMSIIEPQGFLTNKLGFHKELLGTLSSKDVYQFYHHLLDARKPFIFLYGSEELLNAIPLLEDYYKNVEACEVTFDCNHFLSLFEETKIVDDVKPYRESELHMVYKVKDMKESDRFPLMIIRRMLDSNVSPRLENKLREEAKIVYSASVDSYSHFGLLYVDCGFDKKFKDNAIQKVKETLSEISDKKIIEECLVKLKEQQQYQLLRSLDSKYYDIGEFIDGYFGVEMTFEEEIKALALLQPETIQELLSRLKLDLVYFLRGDEDGK